MQKEAVDRDTINQLRQIMGDDFGQLVDVFISDSQKRIDDLREAISQENCPQVRAIAHGFKGSALNLSAHQLTELCRQLEHKGRDGELEGVEILLADIETEFVQVTQALKRC